MLPFSDEMTFFQRWFNTLVGTLDAAIRKFAYLPQEEEYTRKYFSHLESFPTIEELHRRVALVFVNSHRALAPPRPTMPSIYKYTWQPIKIDRCFEINSFSFPIRCNKHRWRTTQASQAIAKGFADIFGRIKARCNLFQFGNSC